MRTLMTKNKPRYKNKQKQALYEWGLKRNYPVSIEKDGLGGSGAHAWNLGYEGKQRPGRYAKDSDCWVLYYAGKEAAKLNKV